ncbi:bifunctional metallophosphatase/5'-nucleotidase [Pontibacillus salicampi]|uniref:Bifunctional metallophosphatase/5'-nucleotidase n=1 Tax=Pontibacillus salicampi TaxID=1449801 RepID=A0ABV6LKE0_9BACI
MWKKQKVLTLFFFIILVFPIVVLASESLYSKDSVEVQLLGVNDLHGQLNTPLTYKGEKVGGISYLTSYLQEYEQKNPNTLLVHAGDMIGGSPPISSLFQDEPAVKWMNYVDFDVGTLGNHEFDEGVPEMQRMLKGGYHEDTGYFTGSTTPYTTANVIDKQSGSSLLPPYIIKEVHGVKIGFIGVVTTDTKDYVLSENLQNVEITDEVKAINKAVAELKEKNINSIVVLGHVAAKSNKNGQNPGREFVDMASEIDDEVDVMFAGHNHTYANTEVDGKLIVQAYSYGKAFSKVDLTIDPTTQEITNIESNIIYTYHKGMTPDNQTELLLKKYDDQLKYEYKDVIANTDHNIAKKPNKNGESPLAQLISRSLKEEMDADIGFVHHGGIRTNVSAGPVRPIDFHTVLPFKHNGIVLSMTGEEIKSVLMAQWSGEKENILQFSGMTYDWKKSAKGVEVSDLKDQQNHAIEPTKHYEVAVTHYLANGGDGFKEFAAGDVLREGPELVDIVINYVKKNGLENR